MDAMDTTPSPIPSESHAIILVFGPFALHRSRQLLLKDNEAVRLGSRAFTLLVELVESAGQLRTRAQLEARVWPRLVMEETSLRVHMSALRKALGDGRDGARYISNVPGCGYSFVATVTQLRAPRRAAAPGKLPLRLVGREDSIAALRLLCGRARLLSIVGPAGIGKSSLARAVGAAVQEQYADGVLLVDLASVTNEAGVMHQVAGAAGVALPAADRLAALAAHLRDKHLLLILDNCDRAIDGAAALAIALLHSNPGLSMLASSREPLDVHGEQVHWVEALRMPAQPLDDVAQAYAYPAIQLFVQQATAHDDRFVLDRHNVADLCRLCHYLDGIPLAIELAAARVEGLGVAGLAARIGDMLDLLTRARRTAEPRHRTMAAALAWSIDLLDAQERTVLRRSAIFEGDVSLDAMHRVCACVHIDAATITRCVETLAARSLLLRRVEGNRVLYRHLQLTRSFVLAELDAAERARLASAACRAAAALPASGLGHAVPAVAQAGKAP